MGIGRLGFVLGGLFSEGVSMLTEQDLRDLLIAIKGVWEVSDVSNPLPTTDPRLSKEVRMTIPK